jgi:DNA-3-methyladenine glycosylase
MLLSQEFFLRDAGVVARDLLGCTLVRDLDGNMLKGKIVETEAYFGAGDPASRAYGGRIKEINRWMWEEGGISFVYMVHNNYLFNLITGRKGEPSGVLIRAIEPLEGVEKMKENRSKIKRTCDMTNGPGKLTKAMGITKEHNGLKVYNESSVIRIEGSKRGGKVGSSRRIGVSMDLDRDLRFFLKDNPFVSRKGSVQNVKR